MPRKKTDAKSKLLEKMLREASWSISRAIGLNAVGSTEAEAEWQRAAEREEQVACLLEIEGYDIESAVHHVSAASCYARIQQYVHAIALVRTAMSFSLQAAYRQEVEKLLKTWLPKAKRQLRGKSRKHPATAS